MDIFTVLFYQPLFNLLVVLYRLFSENLGLAIIAIALLSRLVTLPITIRQMKMTATSKEMQKKMDEIKKKYKNKDDRKEQQQKELMAVQSEYLPAQLAGCLPAILQLILFINVYNVINNIIAKGVESFNIVAYSFVPQFPTNYTLNTNFLGIFDLKTAAAQLGLTNTSVIPYLIIVVLVAVTQYFSMKYMMGNNPVGLPTDDKKEEDKGKGKNNKNEKYSKKDEKAPDDFGSIMAQSSKQTALLFPLMIGLISYNVASGVGFYWIAQSSFVIIQQFITRKLNQRQKKA